MIMTRRLVPSRRKSYYMYYTFFRGLRAFAEYLIGGTAFLMRDGVRAGLMRSLVRLDLVLGSTN